MHGQPNIKIYNHLYNLRERERERGLFLDVGSFHGFRYVYIYDDVP